MHLFFVVPLVQIGKLMILLIICDIGLKTHALFKLGHMDCEKKIAVLCLNG